MKILAITGITGKSGSVFAKHLAENIGKVCEQFDAIRCFLINSGEDEKLNAYLPNAERCYGNLKDYNFVRQNLADVDTLVHIAGIHWSREVVQAAVDNKVRRLILVHTTGIYSKYKAAGEEYRHIDAFVYDICKKNNIVLTILRPTMIYGTQNDGNVTKFIKMVDKLPVMPVVNGANYELQPVHYTDLGKAYYDVLMNEETTANKDFNLSGGAPIYLRDMLKVIGQYLGKKVSFVSVPYFVAYPGAILLYLLTFTKIDIREKVQRLCEPRVFAHEEAKQAFGYAPVIFQKGVKSEIEKYIANKGKN